MRKTGLINTQQKQKELPILIKKKQTTRAIFRQFLSLFLLFNNTMYFCSFSSHGSKANEYTQHKVMDITLNLSVIAIKNKSCNINPTGDHHKIHICLQGT